MFKSGMSPDGCGAEDAWSPRPQVRSRLVMRARTCVVVGACGAALFAGVGTAQANTGTAPAQAEAAAVEYDTAPADDAGQATPEEEAELLALFGDDSAFSPGKPPDGLDPSALVEPTAELQPAPDDVATVLGETEVDPGDEASDSATQERRTCGGDTSKPRRLYPNHIVYVKGTTECKKHRVYVLTGLWVEEWWGWRFVNQNQRQDWKHVSTLAAWNCGPRGGDFNFMARSYHEAFGRMTMWTGNSARVRC